MNNDDRIEMAKEIAEVRKTGMTNMFDRSSVIEILRDLGHDDTAEYLRDNRDEYMELLKLSGKY
jgi:chorismate mutase